LGIIWTPGGSFKRVGYASEAELEEAILLVQAKLFGPSRLYLDVKKKIGSKGGVRNVPDGYLIDLSSSQPRLYVVENELSAHDPLRHIAVQILQFSLSFESEPRAVKAILFGAIQKHPSALQSCGAYVKQHGYSNVDHLLEHLVFETPFAALVIIDELSDNLENVLASRFAFGVEVLELARYQNPQQECIYACEPFLADLEEDVGALNQDSNTSQRVPDISDVDTVVVPAREEGFQSVFLGEQRWYSVRIHGTMRPQIKHIAAYRVAPVSAITHIAPVKSVEPWKDTSKYVVNFSEPAKEIGPLPLVRDGLVGALRNLRYTTRERLLTAKTLDDLWTTKGPRVDELSLRST
jgi:hypothetical protein